MQIAGLEVKPLKRLTKGKGLSGTRWRVFWTPDGIAYWTQETGLMVADPARRTAAFIPMNV